MIVNRRRFLSLAALGATMAFPDPAAGGKRAKKTERMIVDCDMGGDEMQALSVLLANNVDIAGITCVSGNTDLATVKRNAASILDMLRASKIPLYAGASTAMDGIQTEGDNAFSASGVGSAMLERSRRSFEKQHAVDFILETLRNNPEQSITLSATGPLTNIALAFQKDPQTMRRVKNILVMGGCTTAMPAADMPTRQGNITPFAEFNFYMDPIAAKIVMQSGLPVTLFPMNCTQQLFFSAARKKALLDRLSCFGAVSDQIVKMMSAPEDLDTLKFGSPPFMHDVHVALHRVDSLAHSGRLGFVDVETVGERKGMTHFKADIGGNIMVMERVTDPDASFAVVLNSLEHNLGRGPRSLLLNIIRTQQRCALN